MARLSVAEYYRRAVTAQSVYCNLTHVQLYGCRSQRPSGSCSGGKRPLCRRTADRCRTVPASTCRWCTSRTGRNSPGGCTFVRRFSPDIATTAPRCIPGIGSLRNDNSTFEARRTNALETYVSKARRKCDDDRKTAALDLI